MRRSKTAYLREENLLTLLSQNNFIVPEIQREYVWGNNERVVVSFLKELKLRVGEICGTCNQPLSDGRINIGFLYSYKPDYVKVKHERFLDENLIDGQQRFTTLFLLLFCCALKENKKRNFLALIRYEEQIGMSFDFKVRDLTRRFLLDFVKNTDSLSQIQEIENQTWFLSDYRQDVSIQSMLKTLRYILREYKEDSKFYDFFLSNVVFWHFKTEATSQGEELYITMNARGEELAENEITKAALMLDEDELIDSGKKWEEWQQFFWKHRNKRAEVQSADFGFNGFLNCIAGFEYYQQKKAGRKPKRDLRTLLDTEKVEKHLNALTFLVNEKDNFKKHYPDYSQWVDDALGRIWQILNENDTDWFADHNDDKKGTDRTRMVFVWSVLSYIYALAEDNKLNEIDAFRFLRLHYIRFNNFDRSAASIVENVRTAFIHGPLHLHGTEEEQRKHEFLGRVEPSLQKRVEQLIWQIEDHPLNLNARDLSAVNISHLVEFEANPSVESLEEIRDSFYSLFPDKATKGSDLLRSVLLFYGSFWKDTSTWYYLRYDFSEWRRHIRNSDFNNFFLEYMNQDRNLKEVWDNSVEQFLEEKTQELQDSISTLPEPSLQDRFRYYCILLGPKAFWSQGDKIAIRYDVPDGEVRLFENEKRKIYNSKGTFKGYFGNVDLWTKAKELHANPLEHLQSLT